MAPFNNRQIGYIQAIAGRQQHVTLICGQDDGVINSEDGISGGYRPCTLRTSIVNNVTKQHVVGGVTNTTSSVGDFSADAKSLFLQSWSLDHWELGFDSRTVHNNDKLEKEDFDKLNQGGVGFGANRILNTFVSPMHSVTGNGLPEDYEMNAVKIPSNHRATQDGFLNSTNCKFRFTLPTDTNVNVAHVQNPMGQDHYEFRWIVWRAKRPSARGNDDGTMKESNMDMIRNGCSFRNPGYDFFMGQTGRKRGFLGYTHHPKFDQNKEYNDEATEQYSGKYWSIDGGSFADGQHTFLYPTGEDGFTVDDLLTMPINRTDYVVMKDVRFFLGKEHGKSHFEDTLHWDWNDPIDVQDSNVLNSPTLNNKNYRWHMTLIGTSGGKNPVLLNHQVRWTTKMESG